MKKLDFGAILSYGWIFVFEPKWSFLDESIVLSLGVMQKNIINLGN